jgi:hypothetical protein
MLMYRALTISLLIVFATGCGTVKAPSAPFTLYNASLLGDDISPTYPRSAGHLTRGVDTVPLDTDRMVASAPAATVVDQPAPRRAAPAAPVAPRERPAAPAPKASGPTQFQPAHAAGFIRAVYLANGVDMDLPENDDAVALLYAAVKRRGKVYHATRPAVGDIVFFHNTYDRNGDGRNNDWYTHVGMVEAVDDKGNVHVLSYKDGKVTSFAINLEHPRKSSGDGIVNVQLRPRAAGDADFTQYLGGELFAGFGNLLGERTELVVIDNWVPGMKVPIY